MSSQTPEDLNSKKLDLGAVGIFTGAFETQRASVVREGIAALDERGWPTLWIGESTNREVFANAMLLLEASHNIRIASGIANMQVRAALSMHSGWMAVSEAHEGRFVLGVGVSHSAFVDRALGGGYKNPYSKMVQYLNDMDAAIYMGPRPVTTPQRMLGALGPHMMRLAGERTAGALSYFMPPTHTALARVDIGPHATLAVEQMVVLETDPAKARATAIAGMRRHLALPNYTNSLARVGYTDSDINTGNGEPSQRLIDAVVVWGDEAAIVARVREHQQAGADHVCVQILSDTPTIVPHNEWNRLADALL